LTRYPGTSIRPLAGSSASSYDMREWMLNIGRQEYHKNQCQFGSDSQHGGHGGSKNGAWIACGGGMMAVRMELMGIHASNLSLFGNASASGKRSLDTSYLLVSMNFLHSWSLL
jgi:hypothetical protein